MTTNALHLIHRYGTLTEITALPNAGTVEVGVVYVTTDATVTENGTTRARMFYGLTNLSLIEFASKDSVPTITATDTATVDLSYNAAGELSADVIVSAGTGNAISVEADGLYVPTVDPLVKSVEATTSATPAVDGTGKLTVEAIVSPDADNYLASTANGLKATNYVRSVSATTSATPTVDGNGDLKVAVKVRSLDPVIITSNGLALNAGNTQTVTHLIDPSTGALKADVNVSVQAGNILEVNSSGLYVPTPSANYVTAIEDTATVDLTNTAGTIKADVILDSASDNAISVTAGGLYAKKLTIGSNSTAYAEINASNELTFTQFLIGRPYVNANATDLADYVAGDMTTDGIQRGDIVVLTAATGGTKIYYCTAEETPVATSDFVLIEAPDVTDAYVRSLISAGNGIAYNASTGVVSAKLSADTGNDITFGTDNGLMLDVSTTAVNTTTYGSHTVTAWFELLSDDIATEKAINVTQNGRLDTIETTAVFSATNAITKSGTGVKLGGALVEATTIANAGFDLTFSGTAATKFANEVEFTNYNRVLKVPSANGTVWHMTVNNSGQWVGVPLA